MAKPPYQVRIKDKILEKAVDACIEDIQKQLGPNERGATSIALERLLQKSFDDERRYREEIERLSGVVNDLRQDVAALRKQVALLRSDFGHCLRSLLVAARLTDKETAEAWFAQYYETGEMTKED